MQRLSVKVPQVNEGHEELAANNGRSTHIIK
jgi:hypothetical protein